LVSRAHPGRGRTRACPVRARTGRHRGPPEVPTGCLPRIHPDHTARSSPDQHLRHRV